MEWGDFPVRWNNSDPGTVKVQLPTLRKLLGLPMYPFFDRDIFHEQPPTFPITVAQDMEDIVTPLNKFFVANNSDQSDQILLESVYRCHNRRKHKNECPESRVLEHAGIATFKTSSGWALSEC